MEKLIRIEKSFPYFAEIPYYLWGEVNYDSDGDCKYPTDTGWNDLYLKNRVSKQVITIESQSEKNTYLIKSDHSELISKVIYFLKYRSAANYEDSININEYEHNLGIKRTNDVIKVFENSVLKPFDLKEFWGSWKWIGHFATEYTWVGRWIMNSLIQNDTRAVFLCIDWLKQGPAVDTQSVALRYALNRLTSEKYETNEEWIRWYYGNNIFGGKGKRKYRIPNIMKWKNELDKNGGQQAGGANS